MNGGDGHWARAVARLQWHLYARDVEPHRDRLLRHCRTLTRGDPVAEDLAQEALLRGYATVASLHRGLDDGPAWLARVATNLWIDRLRRERRGTSSETVEDAEAVRVAPGELECALEDLERLLPPKERAAFVLREGWGFSFREVAELLDTTEAAAKMAASRARRRLAVAD